MPITPFHFGPGAAMHAMAPRHISFLAFCAANVLIDVEPGYYMLIGQFPLHRFFHTVPGATLVFAATVLIFLSARMIGALPNVLAWKGLTVTQVAIGAALGVYSHLVLDSIMHVDIRPLAPFSDANDLLHVIPIGMLHLAWISTHPHLGNAVRH